MPFRLRRPTPCTWLPCASTPLMSPRALVLNGAHVGLSALTQSAVAFGTCRVALGSASRLSLSTCRSSLLPPRMSPSSH
eukprot:6648982-Alexandrium_andersonii.AAC.1